MGGLTFVALILACIAAALAAVLIRQRVQIKTLARQMEDFLVAGGKPLPFSVRENGMAPLVNATAEMENRLCLSREKQKEELKRSRDLIADISHQLKTPLSSLRLFCEMDNAPHVHEEIAQIERMERLIYSLLRLERLCADGYAFAFDAHDGAEIIRTAWRSLSPLYPEKKFFLSGEASLRCDEKWLGEAFLNLMKNACEHTRPDGSILVSLESVQGAFFAVFEDDGGGVSPKALPHIFDRFYRADAKETTGAGIGLAITREIVRHHHGHITAKNTPRGLRVTVCIPEMHEQFIRTA